MGASALRTLDELATGRDAWLELQDHPWSDFDYFVEHLGRREEFQRPHVVVGTCGERVTGILAGRLVEERVPLRIGGRQIVRAGARVLRVAAGGHLGRSTPEETQPMLLEVLAALERGEADLAYFHQLEGDDPLVRACQELPGRFARDPFHRRVPRWTLELPESWEPYLASRSKSVRKHLRRGARRIERELPGLRFVRYREPAELDRILADTERIARKTYQRRLGVGFHLNEKKREQLAWMLAAGWLRAHFAYDGERPLAFSHDVAYAGSLHMGDTGYDPDEAANSPGTWLLAKTIASACEDPELQRLDFGAMDADYKRDFGTHRSELVSLYVFSRRPKGLALALGRAATGATDRVARSLLGSQRARRWARRLGSGRQI